MLYLFGAKKMQTSAKKACFQFAECSFSSAKIRLFLVTSKVFGENVGRVIKKKNRRLPEWRSPIEYCCFDDETKDYLFFADFLNLLYHFVIGLLHLSVYPPCNNYTNEGSCATTIEHKPHASIGIYGNEMKAYFY